MVLQLCRTLVGRLNVSIKFDSPEFVADMLGSCVVEVVEDGQGTLPCVLGRVGIAEGLVGVPDTDEDVGFDVAADLLVYPLCVLVAAGGFDLTAKTLVGVGGGFPCIRLPVAVVGFAEQVK